MHATSNSSDLHFVGDGCEVISAHATADEASSAARRLNEQHKTSEYVSYAVDVAETDDQGALVFAAEAAAARAAGVVDTPRTSPEEN